MIGKIFKYGLVICAVSYMISHYNQKSQNFQEIEKKNQNLESRLEQTNSSLNSTIIAYKDFQKYEKDFINQKLKFNSTKPFLDDFFNKEAVDNAEKFEYIHKNPGLKKGIEDNYLKESSNICNIIESYNKEIIFLTQIKKKGFTSHEVSTEIKNKYNSKIEFMLDIISNDLKYIETIKSYDDKFPSLKMNNFYQKHYSEYSKLLSEGRTLSYELEKRGE